MWFIFPQLRGLGRSATADFYGMVASRNGVAVGKQRNARACGADKEDGAECADDGELCVGGDLHRCSAGTLAALSAA
jgi:Protein of unknown function (DUF1810)